MPESAFLTMKWFDYGRTDFSWGHLQRFWRSRKQQVWGQVAESKQPGGASQSNPTMTYYMYRGIYKYPRKLTMTTSHKHSKLGRSDRTWSWITDSWNMAVKEPTSVLYERQTPRVLAHISSTKRHKKLTFVDETVGFEMTTCARGHCEISSMPGSGGPLCLVGAARLSASQPAS